MLYIYIYTYTINCASRLQYLGINFVLPHFLGEKKCSWPKRVIHSKSGQHLHFDSFLHFQNARVALFQWNGVDPALLGRYMNYFP